MSDEEEETLDIFQEPADYFKPEKPCTFQTSVLEDGQEITVRLIGFNPLWGHHLWNGARVVTRYLLAHAAELIHDKCVLELGAGAALPSLVCGSHGARIVVATDYPDADLIGNIGYNIKSCPLLPTPSNVVAEGYVWGAPIGGITAHLNAVANSKDEESTKGEQLGNAKKIEEPRFDTVILADLLFNHSEHHKLLQTVRLTLARARQARALVFFTPYRPWLLENDLAFFDLARRTPSEQHNDAEHGSRGVGPKLGVLRVEKVLEEVMDKVMFEEDRGDELLRRTVFGYELMWADLQS